MNPALAGVAIAVLVGATVAVTARDVRVGVVGLAAMLVAAPLLADPAASPIGLAARLAGALLGTYLLWIAVRGGVVSGGSRLGWPADLLLAAAAAVVGYGTHGLGVAPLGPPEAQAAAFGLAALAVTPVATARDVARLGLGLLILLQAALLVRVAVGGTPGDLEAFATALVVAALGGALAALVHATGSRPGGDALPIDPPSREPRPGLPHRSRTGPDRAAR